MSRSLPNHNASKLIDKYNNLAREALSNGDKILSENYFQYADHFTRILSEQEAFKKNKLDKKNHLIKFLVGSRFAIPNLRVWLQRKHFYIESIENEYNNI